MSSNQAAAEFAAKMAALRFEARVSHLRVTVSRPDVKNEAVIPSC